MQHVIYAKCIKPAGFTLIEILVSLAILSISLSATLYVINQNTHNLAYIKNKSFAHWVAMNKIAEFRAYPLPIQKSRMLRGSYVMARHDWKWTAQLMHTEDKELDKIIIEVYSPENNDIKITTLTSFMSFSLIDKQSP